MRYSVKVCIASRFPSSGDSIHDDVVTLGYLVPHVEKLAVLHCNYTKSLDEPWKCYSEEIVHLI
jgi:hypothetical protein